VAGTTTITLPAATDTLVGKATTDTLTNKTLTGAVMNGTLGATTPSTVAATTISASSTATFAAGAVGTPSITTDGDTNTGIFFPAADTIAFSEGGAEAMRINSGGNILQNLTTYPFGGSNKFVSKSATATEQQIFAMCSTNDSSTYIGHNGTVGILGTTYSSTGSYLPLAFYTSDAERMRINAGAPILCLSGGNTSATGTGIAFPATQSASSDANTLDDYEEGTFTATITGSTTAGTASYTAQTGYYTKIGNTVAISLYIDWSSGTGTGGLRISGFPFTSASSRYQSITIGQFENVIKTVATTVVAQMNPNATLITFVEIPTGGGVNSSVSYDAAGNIFVSGVYFV
jgi:hypothetical protein